MNRALLALPLAALALSATPQTENDFLQSLSGTWQGTGQVRLRPDANAVSVRCTLNSRTIGSTLNLDGNCRAKVILSRRIGIDLHTKGLSYSGSYVGSTRGRASLSGQRSGDTLNLQVKWPDRGSGTRIASMQLASSRLGEMRVVTIERHPRTGARIVTASIGFSRQ
ncbi:hypothetical protein [Aminobacter carboxidus]|uniref:Uncharacterized protein n=1 Tax=Aminobacter carboxidus TaxID=376165 RepID=A0ABR9GRD4_9HYPH|nr:hypothetical protein [Aminobacter carboxidus]MBE1206244.1 hypothetical protein [Aminobacter carboxidus]